METSSRKILIQFIHFPVLTLGPGRRVGIWTRGCSIHCLGCISEHLWDFDEKRAREIEDVADETERYYRDFAADGVTISGGEPFDQPEALVGLLKEFRAKNIGDILIYTGYRTDDLLRKYPDIMGLVSAMVDSPFKLGDDTDYGWKGSSNQTLKTFGKKYAERYKKWRDVKKGTLQLANTGEHLISIGIPRQRDAHRIMEIAAPKTSGEADVL